MPNFEYAEFADKFPKLAGVFSGVVEDKDTAIFIVLPTYELDGEMVCPVLLSTDKNQPWGSTAKQAGVNVTPDHEEYRALIAA